ncbi:MAG: hypothetical protein V4469_04465 [Patescibacteria group bacterium]
MKRIYEMWVWKTLAEYRAYAGFWRRQWYKIIKYTRRLGMIVGAVTIMAAVALIYREVNPLEVRGAENITIKTVQIPVEFPPILQKICNAEVTGNKNTPSHQFNKDGSVVRGKVTPSDIGYCQINEPIWNDTARGLGYDIFTEEGNKAMALWLFMNYGDQPWYLSEVNWSVIAKQK